LLFKQLCYIYLISLTSRILFGLAVEAQGMTTAPDTHRMSESTYTACETGIEIAALGTVVA